MSTVIHSPFLQALGYAIINSLWQFALLWLLYVSLNTIFKLSSHQKYTAGLVLELAGFTWFLGTLIFYYKQCLLLAQQVLINQHLNLSLTNSTASSVKRQFFLFVFHSEKFVPYLSVAYLALLFILAARWLYAYNYTQKVRIQGIAEIADTWQSFVQKLSGQLAIGRRVSIFLSEFVQTPLTVGFLKPVILIPVATINYLTPQQLEAVILHELAHIKRFDYLFNLLLALIEACLFFNPFLQLINRQVKKERENCCDDWVLKYDYSAASYARALLQIASHQSRSPLLALKATDNKQLLINRIKRIIEKKEPAFFNYKYQLLALLVMTAVFSLLSFLSPDKKLSNTSISAVHPGTALEPIAAKVSNPLFNPVFFLASSSKDETEQLKKPSEIKTVKASSEVKLLQVAPEAVELTSPPELFTPENENDVLVNQPPANREVAVTLNDDLAKNENLRSAEERLQSEFSKEVHKQRELAQIQLKRFSGAIIENHKLITFEKLGIQLKNALEQIKLTKSQAELNKLQSLVRSRINKARKEISSSLLPDETVFRTNELELLEKQLQSALDSINQSTFFTAALNTDVNYNFQFPAIKYKVEPEEKEHTFSYDYSPATRIKVIKAPVAKEYTFDRQKGKENVLVIIGDEEETGPAEIPPPPAPVKLRVVRIIHI